MGRYVLMEEQRKEKKRKINLEKGFFFFSLYSLVTSFLGLKKFTCESGHRNLLYARDL